MIYENFDLEITQHTLNGREESFAVRVLESPAGQQKASAAHRVVLPPDLRARVRVLDRRGMDRRRLIELGTALADALFPPPVRAMLETSRLRLSEARGLRIRLRFDQLAPAGLPWEYTYLPRTEGMLHALEGFLCLDRRISIVRYELMNQPVPPLARTDGPLRFIGLFSSPETLEPLRVDHERRLLERALTKLPALEVECHLHAGLDSLLDAFAQPAHVLHFAGHGIYDTRSSDGKGYLVLEDDQRRPVPLSAERLALSLQSRGLRLAVLAACQTASRDEMHPWTGVAPALVRAGVPAVVGMQFRIYDENTVTFNRHLYHTLLHGQPIDSAVTAGRLAILARSGEEDRDWGVPVLYMRSSDGAIFPKTTAIDAIEADLDTDLPTMRSLTGLPAVRSLSRKKLRSADALPLPVLRLQGAHLQQLKTRLRDVLHGKFSLAELYSLADELDIDAADIARKTRLITAMQLVEICAARDSLPHLLAAVRRLRPGALPSADY